MILDQIPQFLVSGLTNGSIYALIALGFCLIENATGLVNLAQGEMVMLGAMTTITLSQGAGLPVPLAALCAISVTAAVGVLCERGPLRTAKSRDILTLVLITMGLSITLRGAAVVLWGGSPRTLATFGGDTPMRLLNAAILPQTLWIFAVSIVTLGVLYLFFHRTIIGKAMRAVADNPRGAVLLGIPGSALVSVAFGLAGGLGALSGILVTPLTSMSYGDGVMLGLKGFAGAVLGGYGSTAGAVLGGVLLGVLESLSAGLVSSAYKDATAFLILLLVLFARPAGLFGSARVRRL